MTNTFFSIWSSVFYHFELNVLYLDMYSPWHLDSVPLPLVLSYFLFRFLLPFCIWIMIQIFATTVKYGSNEHACNENSPVKKKIPSPFSILFFISILAVKKFACNKQIWKFLSISLETLWTVLFFCFSSFFSFYPFLFFPCP